MIDNLDGLILFWSRGVPQSAYYVLHCLINLLDLTRFTDAKEKMELISVLLELGVKSGELHFEIPRA